MKISRSQCPARITFEPKEDAQVCTCCDGERSNLPMNLLGAPASRWRVALHWKHQLAGETPALPGRLSGSWSQCMRESEKTPPMNRSAEHRLGTLPSKLTIEPRRCSALLCFGASWLQCAVKEPWKLAMPGSFITLSPRRRSGVRESERGAIRKKGLISPTLSHFAEEREETPRARSGLQGAIRGRRNLSPKFLLPQRLKQHQRGAVRQINRARSGVEHRDAQPAVGVLSQQLLRQTGRLAAEHEIIAHGKSGFRVKPRPARFDKPESW